MEKLEDMFDLKKIRAEIENKNESIPIDWITMIYMSSVDNEMKLKLFEMIATFRKIYEKDDEEGT